MEKYMTITSSDGQKHNIDLTRIFAVQTDLGGTELYIDYRSIRGSNTPRTTITHETVSPLYEFKVWFVDEMERILATDWKTVSDEPTPPYAVTTIA